VYFREGRLDDAAEALARAREAGAPPWTLAWYAALVDREYGRLAAASERLENLMETRFQEARDRGFDFSRDLRVPHLLGQTLFEQARTARGDARRAEREALLQRAVDALQAALAIDPEAAVVHHTFSQVRELQGDRSAAAQHRAAHERYRIDDLAVATAVARHRAANPPANHAAEAVTLYDLQPRSGTGPVTPSDAASFAGSPFPDSAETTIAADRYHERQEALQP